MNRTELAAAIYRTSHITGQFTLRSGQISSEYFDKYLFEADPVLLAAIAQQMQPLVPQATQVLAGLETGGIPLATALSLRSGLPQLFVRKQAKTYGTCKLAEGPPFAGQNICVIEDVVTTGGQILLSVEELRKAGARIDTVLCVILRDERGREALAAQGLTLHALFTMQQLKQTAQ